LGDRGYFIQPAIFTGAKLDATIMREEIFGPVVSAVPFGDDDLTKIAVLANDTSYGLAASIWTRDLSTAHKLAARIQAGTIEINGAPPMQFSMPFGGFKKSGIGRENGYDGIAAFSETKSIIINL
jgi:phenylacetaldehyde dehydrogenase